MDEVEIIMEVLYNEASPIEEVCVELEEEEKMEEAEDKNVSVCEIAREREGCWN